MASTSHPDRQTLGRAATACAAVAVLVVLYPAQRYSYKSNQKSVYDWSSYVQAATLLVSAVWIWRSRAYRAVAAVIGLLVAAQLAGTGVVAYRRWFTSGGFVSHASNEAILRALAVAMAFAGAAAVVVMLLVLRNEGALRFRSITAAVSAIVAACAVAVAVPLVMGYEPGNRTTQVGAHALMHSLPWAMAILLTGWLGRRDTLAATAAVAVSALPLLRDVTMIPTVQGSRGFLIAVAACMIVAGARAVSPDAPRA